MNGIKWHIELLRIGITIVSIIVTLVWFGAKLDKQIALNTQAIKTNQETIAKIMDNHLPHIQEAIDETKEVVYEIKAMLK